MSRRSILETLETRRLFNAQPVLAINDAFVIEGNAGTKNVAVTVNLLQPRPHPAVTVGYSTQNGTAQAGTDFQASSGTVTFGANETSKTILIPVIGDRIIEPDETFLVNLKNPKGAKISNSQATVIITDDDPRVSIANASATEGNTGTSALNFTVSLSGATDVPVTVNYSTQDGTALAGTDYQAATGSVTFAAGEISKTIAVQMIGERVAESDEYFYLNLQPGTNAIIAQGQGQATGTIVDDEPLVSIAAASADEGHSSTTPMTFTVSLSAASDLPVTVNYSTQDVTAGAGADYVAASGSVTFAVGETSKTIPVSVIGDRNGEGHETFSLNLQPGANANIATGQATGTILDDEPIISVSDVYEYEGASGNMTPFVFTVSLNRVYDQTVTVSFVTADAYPWLAGVDYVANSGSLSFAPGETSKTVTVQVIGNDIPEDYKYFYVNLSGASSNASVNNYGTGVIYDDDGYYYDYGGGYYDPGYGYYSYDSYFVW